MKKRRKKKEEVEILIDPKGKIWYLPVKFSLLERNKIKQKINKLCG